MAHGLLGRDVGAVLHVVVLPLLLRLEPQARQTAQILLGHGLVNGGAAPDALAVVVRNRDPPVGLALDVAKDDVLNGRRQARNLPGDVALPTAPRLGQVLQHGVDLVLLDALGHHVHQIGHDGRTQLEVKVRLDALLRHRLGHALAVPSLELARQQIA